MCQVCSQEAEWRGHKAKQSAQKSTNTHLRDHSKTTNLLVLQRQLWRLKNWEAASTRFNTLPSAFALSQNNWKTIFCLLLASFYRDRVRYPMQGEQCLHSYLIILRACSNNSAFQESPSFIPTGFFFQDPGSFPWLTSLSPLKVLHRHF